MQATIQLVVTLVIAALFSHNHAVPYNKHVLIVTWNANSISKNSLEFLHFFNIHNVDVAYITETRLSPSKKLFFRGYKTLRVDRSSNGGGVAIIVKSGIDFEPIRARAPPCESIGVRLVPPTLHIFCVFSPPPRIMVFQESHLSLTVTFLLSL